MTRRRPSSSSGLAITFTASGATTTRAGPPRSDKRQARKLLATRLVSASGLSRDILGGARRLAPIPGHHGPLVRRVAVGVQRLEAHALMSPHGARVPGGDLGDEQVEALA